MVLQRFHCALDLDRVVHAAELDVDHLLKRGGRDLLVAREIHVADERPLRHHERELHAALEVLHADLDVIEEAELEDGTDILSEGAGVEGGTGLALDAPEDHRLLDTAVALNRDVPDLDGALLLLRNDWPYAEQRENQRGQRRYAQAPAAHHRE